MNEKRTERPSYKWQYFKSVDWHPVTNSNSDYMVIFNVKLWEITMVDTSAGSEPEEWRYSSPEQLPKPITLLNDTTNRNPFYKKALRFMGYDYVKDSDGLTIKDLQNGIRNALLWMLDDAILFIQEAFDKIEEEEIIEEETIEDDVDLQELADLIMEKDLIVPFAIEVFDREAMHEGVTAFLIWSSLIGKINVKVVAETCSGKSHISNICEKALPKSWVKKIGYSDPAALKHQIRQLVQSGEMFRILYIQEEDGLNENQQMPLRLTHSDDGGLELLITKKGGESDYYAESEVIKFPELTILTTSTHLTFDKQDSSRRMELSPIGTVEQNEAVVGLKLLYRQFPHLKPNQETEYALLRIIAKRIDDADAKVINPFADKSLIKLSYDSSTIRREIDQLLNLIDILTLFRQKNRVALTEEENEVVLSSVNDLLFTLKIGLHTFGIGNSATNDVQRNIMATIESLMKKVDSEGGEEYRQYVDVQGTIWIPTSLIMNTYLERYAKKQPSTIYDNLRALGNDFKVLYKKEGRSKYFTIVDSDSNGNAEIPDDWNIRARRQLEEWFKHTKEEITSQVESLNELAESLLTVDEDHATDEPMKQLLQHELLEREAIKFRKLKKIIFAKTPAKRTKQLQLATKTEKSADEKIMEFIRSRTNTTCVTSDLEELKIDYLEIRLERLSNEGLININNGNWRC